MTETQPTPQPPVDDDSLAAPVLSQWQFIGRVPTAEDVMALLVSLPEVWGVRTVDFVDYVQALPQNTKVKKPHPTNPSLVVEEYVEVFTLYMSVAGRIKMLERAAQINGWRVDFVPEPVTPSGVPGYLSFEDRLVYRVYVVVQAPIGPRIVGDPKQAATIDGEFSFRKMGSLGRKSGTAWVPAEGGSNAAGSNPYEKVETSALGRALGAWGFGLLPGSGIATVEEMAAIRGNRAALDVEAGGSGRGRSRGAPRRSRQALIEEALTLAEQVRQARGIEDEEMRAKIGAFLTVNCGVVGAYDTEHATIDWGPVKDGQIGLLVNSFTDTLRRLALAESQV